MRREFLLPDPGEGLTEATIVRWLVAAGDIVATNDPIVEIETAKSAVELPSPYDGSVAELLVEEGAEVAVGTPILAVEVPGDDEPEAAPGETVPEEAAPEAAGDGAMLVGYGAKGASHRATRKQRVLAKPPVRKLAKDLGVDLTTVEATGPGGIITREDVNLAASAQEAETLASYPGDEPWLAGGRVDRQGRETRVPVRSVRRRTAEAMVASAFTAPHVTVFQTVDVTKTMELVADLRASREFAQLRVTPLVMVMKALIMAVREHPQINASWDEAAQEIVYKHYVNLGIAASTPRGLVVPNIKDAHRMTLPELAAGLRELTERARAGETSVAEMSQGTITITNVGVFGIDTGTPILNPGEAAILAFGAVKKQPWVHDGELAIRDVTTLALSFDHRLVDGELGSRVLAEVAALLQDPARAFIR
ncbi:dihydrolipoamide acetyltransferase family protein [Bowdeniella massiliensis]|uniref:dihydrolipoamide acetyltransferase family protein n=1 Tax=Bowdeniella massiliensis TaxID=2932264 RepID=UPI0020286D64|nr:dihydrolipoamide acetyltransferase family protein [Bowdeniella massiliensis]